MLEVTASKLNRELLRAGFECVAINARIGIHIIDSDGITRYYNDAMSQIEGIDKVSIIGKHILEFYQDWTEDNSTLLTVLKTGKEIYRPNQRYTNMLGVPIMTVNTSMPIISRNRIIGALEIAENITGVSQLSDELLRLREELNQDKPKKKRKNYYTFDMLVGKDAKYLAAINTAKQAAASNSSVIIYGDTGTGKELFAQSIHHQSVRRKAPFIAINCAALPETLLENILFGSVKGSFTGAENRPGLFEQADGGTLFLDEFNSMSYNLQSKLLRVLQESSVRRVGGLEEIVVDVRIIAATNIEPKKLLESGELRRDLYYRINVISIRLPSLKERRGDIKLILDYFLREFNVRLKRDVWLIESDLEQKLLAYDWGGNVRELRNFVESALNTIGDEHIISIEHLPTHWRELLYQHSDVKESTSEAQKIDLNREIAKFEEKMIREALVFYKGNITKAAASLSISRQNLQYKIKNLKNKPVL